MSIKSDTIEGIDADEQKIIEIHRHWFGLVKAYVEVAIGFIAGMLLLWFLGPMFMADADPTRKHFLISLVVGGLAILVWLVLVVYTWIYRQSKLIMTDKNLTQVLQRGLFSRQVSELSMANVEDVTANVHGAFASMLNYGDLMVETAGEKDNFNFSFCPNPNYYGKIVLDQRQKYIDSTRPGNA